MVLGVLGVPLVICAGWVCTSTFSMVRHGFDSCQWYFSVSCCWRKHERVSLQNPTNPGSCAML